jgi:hypothetical protein
MHASDVQKIQKHDRLIQRAITLALITLAATLVCVALVLYV